MLPVQRLIFAAQLRDAFAATNDRAARKPLDAQDRKSLETTIAALTESGPPSREMADIQLSILTRLPGWPTGLRIVRNMAPDAGGPPVPTVVNDQRQFGPQTSQLAHGDPLLLVRQSDGTWFYARNAAPPHDWHPSPDRVRPLLSACVAALVERYKDEGWRIVAQLAGNSRSEPGRPNESLLLAKLGVRMAEWLQHASAYDQKYPLQLTDSATPPSAPTTDAAQIIRSAAWPPSPAFKRQRTHDTPTRSPDPTAPVSNGVVPELAGLFSDEYIQELLRTPGTPCPRVMPRITPHTTPHLAPQTDESMDHFIDLTCWTPPTAN